MFESHANYLLRFYILLSPGSITTGTTERASAHSNYRSPTTARQVVFDLKHPKLSTLEREIRIRKIIDTLFDNVDQLRCKICLDVITLHRGVEKIFKTLVVVNRAVTMIVIPFMALRILRSLAQSRTMFYTQFQGVRDIIRRT